jgi:4-hydroxysphinganine ceramide fatty acyl 2-hydroxylase
MPPSLGLPLAALFYVFFLSIFGNINVNPFFAAFLIGYLFYDITHYAIHHFNFKGNIWKELKDWHAVHHYKHDDYGFGVSSPIWDHVFKTTYPEKNNSAESPKT